MGVGILGSIGTAIYRSRMNEIDVKMVSTDIVEKAGNTLGEALALAQQLPDQAGAVLYREARAAFVRSFSQTSVVAAVLMLAVAVLVGWEYRREANKGVQK